MNDDSTRQRPSGDPDGVPDLELSDEDILDALKRIPGYVDITTEDFKEVYALAHRHAEDRLLGALRAERLMHAGVAPLAPPATIRIGPVSMVFSTIKAGDFTET